ncbi:MAG: hypothetical protein AAF738_01020, partial [Bacteroidota bacterium]
MVTEVRRATPGFTGKDVTTLVDTASIPPIDQVRFLPGDTLFTQIGWIYPEPTNVNTLGFDGLWIFIASTQPASTVGENLYNAPMAGPRLGDFRRMPSYIDTDRSKVLRGFIGRNMGNREPLVIPDLPCTRFSSIQPDPSLGLTNVDLQDNNVDHAEGFAPAVWFANRSSGNCLDQFIAANNLSPLDTIYFEYNLRLLKNPGLDKDEIPTLPVVNGAWYGQTEISPVSFRYDDCEVGATYEFFCPFVEADTEVTVNACDVVVEHIFTLNPNDVPPGGFSTEFRPISGLSFADITLPNDLIFSGDIEIVDYTGTVVGTVPASNLDLSNYNLVSFMGTDYYVARPDSVPTFGIVDDEFENGGDDRGGTEEDRYPSENIDHTIVGGNFPLLGVGIDQDICEFRLRYSLDRVCPDDVDPDGFSLIAGTSSNNTAISYDRSNLETNAFNGGASQYDTWFGIGTDETMPPNFSEDGTRYWPYSATNFDMVMDIIQPSGLTFPNLYGQMQNPHNFRDTVSGANIMITSADLPSITVSVDRILIADEMDMSEFNTIEVCAQNDGTATLMNNSANIVVPPSVSFQNVYVFDPAAPNNAGASLTATQVGVNAMGTTFQVDLPDLAPSTCYQFVLETELLFCPIGLDFSTEVCIGVTSSCLPTSLVAQLSASADGVCRTASECYEYISQEASLQVAWFIEPDMGVSLCEEVCYAVRIENVSSTPLTGVVGHFFLPSGLEFVPGSWEVAYPGGAVNYDADTDPDMIDSSCSGGDTEFWTPIPDPTQVVPTHPGGTSYDLTIDNSVQPYIAANGLPSVWSETLPGNINIRTDSNRVAFRFRAATVCDEFTSGSRLRFAASGQGACETITQSNSVPSNRLIVQGAAPADFAQMLVVTDLNRVNCGSTGRLNITAVNTSFVEASTLNGRFCLNIPTNGMTYQPGSIRYVVPAEFDPMTQEEDILGPDGVTVVEKEICILVPDDLAPGESFQVALDYEISEAVNCGNITIGAEIISDLQSVQCEGQNQTCSVAVLNSVNPTLDFEILPPLNIENLEVVSKCDDDPGTLVYGYTLDLMNPGDEFASDIELELIRDLDQDGMLDDFETDPSINPLLAGPFTQTVNLPTGGSTTITGEFNVQADIGCPAFIRIRQNSPCACDETVAYIDGAVPEIFGNLGDRQVVCPGAPLNLDICGDYAPSAGTVVIFNEDNSEAVVTFDAGTGPMTLLVLQAVPADGATFSLVGDQFMVTLADGFGVDLPVDINLTVNQGFCSDQYSIDLLQADDLDLGPYEVQTVCTDRKTQLDLDLPTAWRDEATITWSPTTFLDDPTSHNPLICNPTTDITYTVIVQLNNGAIGCGDTVMYPVAIETPQPIELEYSGEVTCFAVEDPPLLTATAGFTNYTFFVLINGEEFVVKTGTDNVYTLPASAPGGTYFVRADDGSLCAAASNTIDVPNLICDECPAIYDGLTPISTCSGEGVDSLKVFTGTRATDGIIFVLFEEQQLVAQEVYDYTNTGGIVLGSTTPMVMGLDTMATISDIDFPMNSTTSPLSYFVYALLNPTPQQEDCRPFAEIEVMVHPAPLAGTAMDELCEDENAEASFVLSSYDAMIDIAGTNTVGYYLTMDNAEDDINVITSNPYTISASTTLFARVENTEGCFAIGTLDLTVNQLPMTPMSLGDQEYCDGEEAPALGVVNPSNGFMIQWFLEEASNTPVSGVTVSGFNNELITLTNTSTPPLPTAGNSVTVYAQIVNEMTGCISAARTPVTLSNSPSPAAVPVSATVCEDAFQSRIGTFDLSLLVDDINADFMEGSASVNGVFTSMNGMMELSYHTSLMDAASNEFPIAATAAYMNTASGSQTLFARLENTVGCVAIVQVQLSVSGQPDADDLDILVCPDAGMPDMRAGIDLTSLEGSVAAGNTPGSFTVAWYSNAGLTNLVPDPTNVTVADGSDFFALISFGEDPTCENVATVTYQVDNLPPITDIELEFCEDEALVGDVAGIDLRENDLTVSGGLSSIVNWFEDDAFTIPVPNPSDVSVDMMNNGTEPNIFYAEVSDGDCTNRARVSVIVFQQPIVDTGGPYEVCAGNGVQLADAAISGSATTAMWTIENQPAGGDGLVLPAGLITDPSVAVFTATVIGDYTLTLTSDDPDGPCMEVVSSVVITVNPLPVATPPLAEVCVGGTVEIDGTPSEGTPTYDGHEWIDLGTGSASGYTLVNTDMQIVTIDASDVTTATAGTIDLQYTVTDSNGCMDIATTSVMIIAPDAGSITPDDAIVCFDTDIVTISATPDGNQNVPAGYEVLYVLTSGAGLVIEEVSATPSFMIDAVGNYTIHTLVYDPLAIDLTAITPGVTTGFDVNALLVQGGGDICAALDVEGAPILVSPLPEVTPMGGNITCNAPRATEITVTTNASNPIYFWEGPGIVSGSTSA